MTPEMESGSQFGAGFYGTQQEEDKEAGSTTVEYAIGAVAAAGFAGLLLVILKSDSVRAALEGIIQQALSSF